MQVKTLRSGSAALLCATLSTVSITTSAQAPPAEPEAAAEAAPTAKEPPPTAAEEPPAAAKEPAAAAKEPAAEQPDGAPTPTKPAQPPFPDGEDRAVPDYDGRGDDPVTAGDVFIWIPRAIFFPVYLVSEYVIRWPLGALTTAVEEHDIPGKLEELFTFGPGNKSGLVPSALIDFGFRPSIGLYFFSDYLIAKDNAIRSHLAFGGIDWYRATLTNRQYLSRKEHHGVDQQVQLRGVFSHRPDWKFYGLGPDSQDDHQSRYTAQRIDGTLSYELGFWRSSQLLSFAGVRDVRFRDEPCCEDPSIGEGVKQGYFTLPPLFDDGYTIARVGAELYLDTRKVRNRDKGLASDFVQPSGSGVKLGLRGEIAGGLRQSAPAVAGGDTELLRYIRYGATLGGFLDVYSQRVIGLSVVADFVDPFSEGGQIPFTELATLGGDKALQGFLQYRMLDRSAVAARLEYRWPVWVSLDGIAHYSVGNTFGEHLEDFSPEKLRQSFGLGLRATGSRDHAFEMLFAFGTETFESGGGVENFRFVVGASSGF